MAAHKKGCCTTKAPGTGLILLIVLRRRRTVAVKTESLEDSDLDDDWDDEELARLRVSERPARLIASVATCHR